MTFTFTRENGIVGYIIFLVCLLAISYIANVPLIIVPLESMASALIAVVIIRKFSVEKNPDLEIPPKTVKK